MRGLLTVTIHLTTRQAAAGRLADATAQLAQALAQDVHSADLLVNGERRREEEQDREGEEEGEEEEEEDAMLIMGPETPPTYAPAHETPQQPPRNNIPSTIACTVYISCGSSTSIAPCVLWAYLREASFALAGVSLVDMQLRGEAPQANERSESFKLTDQLARGAIGFVGGGDLRHGGHLTADTARVLRALQHRYVDDPAAMANARLTKTWTRKEYEKVLFEQEEVEGDVEEAPCVGFFKEEEEEEGEKKQQGKDKERKKKVVSKCTCYRHCILLSPSLNRCDTNKQK